MKKTVIALLLALLLCIPCLAESGEPGIQPERSFDRLTVGTSTAFGGEYFTDLWGNHTSDQDVRQLLEGYRLTHWVVEDATFEVDPSVVSGFLVTANQSGDRVCVISLYDDLFYSDGTQITARDYVFSMLLQASPQLRELGAVSAASDYIPGMEAYRSGESYKLSGVHINSDFQFTITISAEYLPFFYELGLLNIAPYPIHVLAPGCEIVQDDEGVFIHDIEEEKLIQSELFTTELLQETVFNEETGYMKHPSVVAGPYTMTSSESDTLTFLRNPYYKGSSEGKLPQIEELIYKYIPAEALIGALESGEIDLVNKAVSEENITAGLALNGTDDFGMTNYARTGYSFFNCSCERPVMADIEVRRAIAECFDKDTFVKDYVGNYGLRVDSYYGIGQWMYRAVTGALTIAEESETEGEEETLESIQEAVESAELPTLDDMVIYAFDPAAACQRLIDDGWTLNLQGEPFDPETDTVRCRRVDPEDIEPEETDAEEAEPVDETLQTLKLSMIYPEGNKAALFFEASFIPALAQAGIELTMQPVPMDELLSLYYREQERSCDLIYMATNFNLLFNPVGEYAGGTEEYATPSWSGLYDEQLQEYAAAMRTTEPGKALEYLWHWADFVKRWAEVLPTIPVYSNVYFDFYISELHDYSMLTNASWAEAILDAYLSDSDANMIAVPEEEDEADEEGLFTID